MLVSRLKWRFANKMAAPQSLWHANLPFPAELPIVLFIIVDCWHNKQCTMLKKSKLFIIPACNFRSIVCKTDKTESRLMDASQIEDIQA